MVFDISIGTSLEYLSFLKKALCLQQNISSPFILNLYYSYCHYYYKKYTHFIFIIIIITCIIISVLMLTSHYYHLSFLEHIQKDSPSPA